MYDILDSSPLSRVTIRNGMTKQGLKGSSTLYAVMIPVTSPDQSVSTIPMVKTYHGGVSIAYKTPIHSTHIILQNNCVVHT